MPCDCSFRELSPLERSDGQQDASTLRVRELRKPIALRRFLQAIFTQFHLPHRPIQVHAPRRPSRHPNVGALQRLQDGSPLAAAAEADVIVLDWRLPTISGIDLLPQLRQRGVNLPVVFLTSHPQMANEKLALERGALDFIDKTRGVEILASRLRLAAKSGKPAATPEAEKPIVCGKLVLSPSSSGACWNGVDVGLTISEYHIVHFLASNVGNYQTYRAIYEVQYYEGFVAGQGGQGYRTNVRASIKRIRRKFCEVDSTFSEIQNSQSRGYRWRGLTRSQ